MIVEATVDPDGTLPFQKSHRIRDAVFRWNTQKHMNVVRQCIAFHHFDVLLPTELAENLSNLRPKTSVKLSPPVFWNNHNMVLAFSSALHRAMN